MLIVWTEATVADLFAYSVPLDHSIEGICEDPEACDETVLAWVEEQRSAWPATFAAATGGLGVADAAL